MHTEVRYNQPTQRERDAAALADLAEWLGDRLARLDKSVSADKSLRIDALTVALGMAGVSGRPVLAYARKMGILSTWVQPNGDIEIERIGILDEIFVPADPRPARAQVEERYAHGGGWSPIDALELRDGKCFSRLDDESWSETAHTEINGETIRLFPYGIVAVGDTFIRMD